MSVASGDILTEQAGPPSVRQVALRSGPPAGRVHVCACGAPMVGGHAWTGYSYSPWSDCRDREDARERVALARCAAIEAQASVDLLRDVRYVSAEDVDAALAKAYAALRDLMAARTNEQAVELRHTGWKAGA